MSTNDWRNPMVFTKLMTVELIPVQTSAKRKNSTFLSSLEYITIAAIFAVHTNSIFIRSTVRLFLPWSNHHSGASTKFFLTIVIENIKYIDKAK